MVPRIQSARTSGSAFQVSDSMQPLRKRRVASISASIGSTRWTGSRIGDRPQRRNCRASGRKRPVEETLPLLHQLAALLEQLAAPVGRLDLVGDFVGERLLDDVIRIVGPLGAPIAKYRPKAVNGNAGAHAP